MVVLLCSRGGPTWRRRKSCWIHVSFGVAPVLSLSQNDANDPSLPFPPEISSTEVLQNAVVRWAHKARAQGSVLWDPGEGIRVRSDAAHLAPVERIDAGHFSRREREIEDVEVFPHSLLVVGLGKNCMAVLDMPTQHDLGH